MGNFYAGTFDRLFFVADHDASPSNGNSYFRNVKIYEGSCGTSLPSDIVKNQHGIQIGTEGEIGMSLFPNPASEQIQVDLDLPENDGFATILDVTGRVVWSGEVQSGRNSISIDQHGPGLYIFQVSTLSGETVQTKFVKAQ
ncbi:MAG: T9SS type A sorting domain-containing protein [Bacteroidota bacterium]